jgi:drug/metabolite transporter (DMT)-like permease
MSDKATERRRLIVRKRTRGWVGFVSALAAIAGVSVALFFWAEGSVLGAVIGLVVAVVCVSITAASIVTNKRDSADPALDNRMARLRRARYRSAYPRPDSRDN